MSDQHSQIAEPQLRVFDPVMTGGRHPTSDRPQPLLWLILLIVSVAFGAVAVRTPLSRTQEARVLVTAREMYDKGFEGWMIPTANGQVRLRKPPLAYWLSASSFRVFGVSSGAGRLPFVTAAVATLVTTVLIGRRLFSLRAGVFAAAALAGSWLFFKNGLLAETDILVTCFFTIGAYAWLQLSDRESAAVEIDEMTRRGSHRKNAVTAGCDGLATGQDAYPKVTGKLIVWAGVLSLMIGLIALAKGPPAVCLIALVIVLDLTMRKYTSNKEDDDRYVGDQSVIDENMFEQTAVGRSGVDQTTAGQNGSKKIICDYTTHNRANREQVGHAVVTSRHKTAARKILLRVAVLVGSGLIAIPWFLFALKSAGGSQLTADLGNSAWGGRDHGSPFFAVFHMVALAAAPWTFLWAIAVVCALGPLGRYWGLPVGRPGAIWRNYRLRRLKRLMSRWHLQTTDGRGLHFLFVWGVVTFLPLMFWQNKQIHYLLVVMPAVMLTVGWVIDRWLRTSRPTDPSRIVRPIFLVTHYAVFLLLPTGLLVAAYLMRGRFLLIDIAIAAGLLVVGGCGERLIRSTRGRFALATAAVAEVLLAIILLQGVWAPTINTTTAEQIAAVIERDYPGRRLVFREQDALPLCFTLQSVIPVMNDEELINLLTPATEHAVNLSGNAVEQAGEQNVLCIDARDRHEPRDLEGFAEAGTFGEGKRSVILFIPDRR